MRIILLGLLLAASPAMAGERFCNNNLPYEIERIPHGFAVVRMAYSDFCKQDHMSDDPIYTCDGRSDYRLGFDVSGDILTVTYTDGNTATFQQCEGTRS